MFSNKAQFCANIFWRVRILSIFNTKNTTVKLAVLYEFQSFSHCIWWCILLFVIIKRIKSWKNEMQKWAIYYGPPVILFSYVLSSSRKRCISFTKYCVAVFCCMKKNIECSLEHVASAFHLLTICPFLNKSFLFLCIRICIASDLYFNAWKTNWTETCLDIPRTKERQNRGSMKTC